MVENPWKGEDSLFNSGLKCPRSWTEGCIFPLTTDWKSRFIVYLFHFSIFMHFFCLTASVSLARGQVHCWEASQYFLISANALNAKYIEKCLPFLEIWTNRAIGACMMTYCISILTHTVLTSDCGLYDNMKSGCYGSSSLSMQRFVFLLLPTYFHMA